MARSGSNRRQRQATLSARFNGQEAEAVRQLADRAGISVASYIRFSLLHATPPRAARRPTVSHVESARILGELGRMRTTVSNAALAAKLDPSTRELVTALRSLSELCVVILQSMGRTP